MKTTYTSNVDFTVTIEENEMQAEGLKNVLISEMRFDNYLKNALVIAKEKNDFVIKKDFFVG